MKSNSEETSRILRVADEGLTVRQLALLTEVCRTGGIGTAAERAGMTRQALSKSIGQMEETLGGALFVREARGVRPTELAAAILPHAARILSEMESLAGLAGAVDAPRKPLVVRASAAVATRLGSGFLLDFARREPGVSLELVLSGDDEALEALSARTCELALLEGPFDERAWVATPFFRTRLVARMRADHPLAGRERLTAADLAGVPIVGAGRGSRAFRECVERLRLLGGAEVEVLAASADERLIDAMLLDSDAVAIRRDASGLRALGVKSVPLEIPGVESEAAAVVVANRTGLLTRAARSLRDALLEWSEREGLASCVCPSTCTCGCRAPKD